MQRAEKNYSIDIIVILRHINTKCNVILLKSENRKCLKIYWKGPFVIKGGLSPRQKSYLIYASGKWHLN